MTKESLDAGQCQTCKFYLAFTQLEDEWRGGWQQIGTCRNSKINAGLVVPEYGCGAWEKYPDSGVGIEFYPTRWHRLPESPK